MSDNIALAAGFSLSLIGVGAPEAVLSTLAAIAAFVHAGIALIKLIARLVTAIKDHKRGKIDAEQFSEELDKIEEDFHENL